MNDLLYKLNDNPPAIKNFFYSLQWLLIVIPLITVTSNLMARFLGMDPVNATGLFQRFLLVVGLVTSVQVLFGHRYPILDGPSVALLLSVAVLARDGADVVSGGMLTGGIFLAILGGFGLVGKVQALFTDRVIGVVLLLISTTLLPLLLPMILGVTTEHAYGEPLILLISVLLMLLIVILSHWAKGITRNLSIFIGIAVGFAVMAILGRIDLTPAAQLSWIAAPEPFLGPVPRFTVPATVSFILAYIAVLINGLGSYFSVAEVVGQEDIERRIERGVALTGGGGIIAAVFGVVGTVSYSISPGVILVTRVGSRWPVLGCGIFLVILAFFQKAGAVLALVPDSVTGAVLFVTLAAQLGVGISVLVRDGRAFSVRDYIVVGLPLLLGTAASMLPMSFLNLFGQGARSLLGNGLIVGIILVILLEHVVLRER
ncbi:MAG: uracil-xanthine permease family protein, partial [bacterium]